MQRKALQLGFLFAALFYACGSNNKRDKTVLFIGKTAFASSLPLIFSCDADQTYNYIQVGGITVDGKPLDSAQQSIAQDECIKQLANPAGKVVGKARTTCEVWFGPNFHLNSSSTLFAVYQCHASKPAVNITWAKPKQPKDELKTGSQEMSKDLVLKCTGGKSLIDIHSVTMNNKEVNTTEFPELDVKSLATKCYKETFDNSVANPMAAAKCVISKNPYRSDQLTVHYTCKLPPVVTEVKKVFIKVRANETQPHPTPTTNISKENSCLNTRPCLAGGVCVLHQSTAYKCNCVIGRTGAICELFQRPFEAYLNFTALMFMGKDLDANNTHAISQLMRHGHHFYKWIKSSLENEIKSLFLKVDPRTESIAVTSISIGIPITVRFSLYMYPEGVFSVADIAKRFDFLTGRYLTGSGINAEVGAIRLDELHDCRTTSCKNDGVCMNVNGKYECSCRTGFDGEFCERNIDDCKSNHCQNGATCEDGVNSYSCLCSSGFVGVYCETELQRFNSGTTQQDLRNGEELIKELSK